MGRRIPDNGRPALAVVYGPGPLSVQLATTMAVATAPFSPMAAGRHSPGGTARGYSGDRGYGVNRFAGKLPYAVQNFYGAALPVRSPKSQRLGAGAGVSGQPGLPNTGGDAGGLDALAYLGYTQLSSLSMGSG
jgi:hypothetical protein